MRRRKIVAAGLAAIALVLVIFMLALRPPQSLSKSERLALDTVSAPTALQVAEPAPSLTADTYASSPPPEDASEAIGVSVPRMAYVYHLSFRLPQADVTRVQEGHLALCRRMGTSRCQLVSMSRSSADGDMPNGALTVRVGSNDAADFSKLLQRSVSEAGGRASDMAVEAEDVSKDMVDTEARIRQRQILVSRLTDMLRGRPGKVSELVEAERSVAGAQEELDKASAWLGELRGRVAMSTFEIRYQAAAAVPVPIETGFGAELRQSVAASLNNVLSFARGLLVTGIFLLPWLVILLPLLWWVRRRIRTRSSAADEDSHDFALATP